jgi:diguanylate cyclase (GGDEF)-like protein
MTKVIYKIKTGFEQWWGLLLAIFTGTLVSYGYFSPKSDGSFLMLIVLSLLSFGLLLKIISKFKTEKTKQIIKKNKLMFHELELSLLFVVSISVMIQYTGGTNSHFYPINYVLAAFLAAFYNPFVAIPSILIQIGLELLSSRFLSVANTTLIIHSGLILFFATFGFLALRLEFVRLQRRYLNKLKDELNKIKQDARDFRLIGTSVAKTSHNRDDAQKLLGQASVETIHQNLYFILNLLKDTSNLTTAILLWLDPANNNLKIMEASSNSQFIGAGSFSSLKGVVGSIVRNQLPMNLGNFKFSILPYYNGPQNIGSFIGVPVMENGQLRGILCGDRVNTEPFDDSHIDVFKKSSEQIIRTLVTERAFHSIEKSKFEQEKFFNASTILNKALTMEDVIKSGFTAVNSIVPIENIGLIIKSNDEFYKLLGSHGPLLESLNNKEFKGEKSLLSMALESRHYFPINGELRDPGQNVIGKDISFSKMGSVLIIPLIAGDMVLGGFIFASATKGIFNPTRREMLGVITNQVAQSVQNSLMYEKLELMATTDGLTGLTNHRTFQDKLSEMLARASRNKTKISVLITDIDKFKSVNDTYGHPIGDIVIKKVSSILKKQAREIDLVARYGGEEFAVVLEATDKEGAIIFAERVRQEIEAQVFESPIGPFKTSLSLGIATFPEQGDHKQTLIDKSDKSLYWAKEHGRNQVVHFGNIPSDYKS